ncbi:beta-glucosidase [Litoribacter alkaliphilus]|uniref:Beta-glucosidase n=1 Tax=Litoribacter ruber TaxID=702568 RepID=A0AAP2G0T8_9BACT|nr:glucoamylase family protein [Litoribacter alkaliphilus]MBS9522907.1 beta-glucosidase [Litoribacter alkaliphilus]
MKYPYSLNLLLFLLIPCLAFTCEENSDNSPVLATGYDRHVELQWPKHPNAVQYRILVSSDGESFSERATIEDTLYMDFVNDLGNNLSLHYKVEAFTTGEQAETIGTKEVKTKDFSDEELLEMVSYYTFRYFWEGAEPNSGLARERIHIDGEYPQDDAHIITTGGSGFGLFALLAGIERGWITKDQGRERFERIVDFLAKADRFHGIWPHWLNGETGEVKPFGQKDDGGDLVESAFLMQGLLAVREYYKNEGQIQDKQLASKIDQLWEEMEWDWHTQGGQDVLFWHWSPNYGWDMNFPLLGYDETLITYVLAASSPTHSVSADAYHKGWARDGGIKTQQEPFGYKLELKHNGAEEMGGPLFWAHYSYIGLNPKGLKDKYADYWKHNRNHTLINRAWCVENPEGFKGYGEDLWGLTASYSVNGYSAHKPGSDLGVITPTAALSSYPYTPEESMEVIKNMYYNYGEKVFGRYGFYDAFSPEENWYPQRYLAIDQGPIVAMIENHRSGLGWNLFMAAPEIQEGLKKLGFEFEDKYKASSTGN